MVHGTPALVPLRKLTARVYGRIGSGFPGLRNQRFSSGWKPNRVLQLRCRHRHWVQLLKDLVPSVKQVNVMFNPRTSPYNALFMKSIEAAAPSFGMFAISQRMSAFTPLAGVKWIFLTQPKPTLLIPMYGPAVRCKRTSSSWRICGLASMYPAFDWSLLCSRPSWISARVRSR
jgi:hypothetical protein